MQPSQTIAHPTINALFWPLLGIPSQTTASSGWKQLSAAPFFFFGLVSGSGFAFAPLPFFFDFTTSQASQYCSRACFACACATYVGNRCLSSAGVGKSCVVPILGSVPTTPDPNTSAKVSRYKWEAYRDTNWWCIYYFLPQGGHTFAKVCHRNGRCIAILFHMYWGQGSI